MGVGGVGRVESERGMREEEKQEQSSKQELIRETERGNKRVRVEVTTGIR